MIRLGGVRFGEVFNVKYQNLVDGQKPMLAKDLTNELWENIDNKLLPKMKQAPNDESWRLLKQSIFDNLWEKWRKHVHFHPGIMGRAQLTSGLQHHGFKVNIIPLGRVKGQAQDIMLVDSPEKPSASRFEALPDEVRNDREKLNAFLKGEIQTGQLDTEPELQVEYTGTMGEDDHVVTNMSQVAQQIRNLLNLSNKD